MKLCLELGTRPDIIKMSPLIRECQKRGIEFFVLHTGQHYDYEMDAVFFEELQLPQPKYNLKVGVEENPRYHARLMIDRMIDVLAAEKPSIVVIYGDTNTTLAGALAANRLKIPIAHVEAGLRSFDIVMAEEVNRMIADHLSQFLFTPTENAQQNLLNEGIDGGKIYYSGNTIVDAVYQNRRVAEEKSGILSKLGLRKGEYFLVTAHRPENVDTKERLGAVLEGLRLLGEEFNLPVIFPLHHRPARRLREFGFELPASVRAIRPLGFLDFLCLEAHAKLVITDSGGVQEESCILKVPCVTIRGETERPETVEVGSNLVAGLEPQNIVKCAKKMLAKERNWRNPFGGGKAAERILDILTKERK